MMNLLSRLNCIIINLIFAEKLGSKGYENLQRKLEEGTIQEVLENGVELKAKWHQDCGKDISAIANKKDRKGGWLVIGCSDSGRVEANDLNWIKETEQKVSDHISQYLSPDFTVVNLKGEKINNNYVLVVEISSPNDMFF